MSYGASIGAYSLAEAAKRRPEKQPVRVTSTRGIKPRTPAGPEASRAGLSDYQAALRSMSDRRLRQELNNALAGSRKPGTV